jgi:hypothetical protein
MGMADRQVDQAYERLLAEVKRVDSDLKADGRFDRFRSVSDTIELIKGAHPWLGVAGINSLRPAHEGQEAIGKILSEGGAVRFAIGDYKSGRFDERVMIEKDDRIHGISGELAGTLSGFERILGKVGVDKDFKLYVQDHIRGSMIIANRDSVGKKGERKGRVQLNLYSDDVADRGLFSKTYLIMEEDGGPYKAALEFYDTLLKKSTYVPIYELREYRISHLRHLLKKLGEGDPLREQFEKMR